MWERIRQQGGKRIPVRSQVARSSTSMQPGSRPATPPAAGQPGRPQLPPHHVHVLPHGAPVAQLPGRVRRDGRHLPPHVRLHALPLGAAHRKQLVPLGQGRQAATLAQQRVDVRHGAGRGGLQLQPVGAQRVVPPLQLLVPAAGWGWGWAQRGAGRGGGDLPGLQLVARLVEGAVYTQQPPLAPPTHHDSFRSMCSSFCATLSTPTAASGWRSWLLMEMRASTAVWGDDWRGGGGQGEVG